MNNKELESIWNKWNSIKIFSFRNIYFTLVITFIIIIIFCFNKNIGLALGYITLMLFLSTRSRLKEDLEKIENAAIKEIDSCIFRLQQITQNIELLHIDKETSLNIYKKNNNHIKEINDSITYLSNVRDRIFLLIHPHYLPLWNLCVKSSKLFYITKMTHFFSSIDFYSFCEKFNIEKTEINAIEYQKEWIHLLGYADLKDI